MTASPSGKAFLSPALRGGFFCAILDTGKVRCIVKVKKERLFTNRQLLTLLWPLIIEQMLEILVGMADITANLSGKLNIFLCR